MAGTRRSFGVILWLVLAAIIGGGVYWWLAAPKLIAEVGNVKKGQATAAVYGTVLVEPVTQTIVRAQISGVLSNLKIKKGDVVKEGQVLAEILDEANNQALKAATSNMENEAKRRSIGPASIMKRNSAGASRGAVISYTNGSSSRINLRQPWPVTCAT